MKAQTIDIQECTGRILSSAIFRPGGKKLLAKGHILREEDIRILQSEGMEHIWVAELDEDEVSEDEAVCGIAAEMACGKLRNSTRSRRPRQFDCHRRLLRSGRRRTASAGELHVRCCYRYHPEFQLRDRRPENCHGKERSFCGIEVGLRRIPQHAPRTRAYHAGASDARRIHRRPLLRSHQWRPRQNTF